MNPFSIIQSLTSEDVQRYTRIVLQWLAATLVTHGTIKQGAWVEQAVGVGVGLVTLAWTIYGNRLVAKLNELAKHDDVTKIVVSDPALAASSVTPSPKVST